MVEDHKPGFISKVRHLISRRTRLVPHISGYSFFTFFPLFDRLRNYKVQWVAKDVLAGLIVGCFHIPQSMGTGMAANLGPLYGIYLTFFPGLIYAFLGACHHSSVGAFAPNAALVGVAAARIRLIYEANGVMNQSYGITPMTDYRRVSHWHMQIAVSIAFCCGAIQILMSFFKLGFIHRLFTTTILDPFNCAASLQIMLVQIPNMFGVPLSQYFGLCKHIQLIRMFFENVTKVLWLDTLLAMLCASIIIGFREFLQPRFFKLCKLVVPIEFLVMVTGISLSYFLKLHEYYGVIILGDMPTGIPLPSVPKFAHMPYEFFEGLLNALVSVAFLMQSAKTIARKEGYQVSSNQELLALGGANFFASFFSCYVASSPVGRNIVVSSMGSRSQLSALVAAIFTGLLLAFASQTLYYLPTSVIATIIMLTLAQSLKLMWELPRMWRADKGDAILWLTTFVACILLDLEWGLLLGLVISWLRVFYRSQAPVARVLGRSRRQPALWTQLHRDEDAIPLDGFLIVQALGNLHFETAERFLRFVEHHAGYGKQRRETKFHPSKVLDGERKPAAPVKHVILDFSVLNFIDSTGVRALEQLMNDLHKKDISLTITHCKGNIQKALKKFGLLEKAGPSLFSYSVHEAVQVALHPSMKLEQPRYRTVSEDLDDETFWAPPAVPIHGLETADDPEDDMLEAEQNDRIDMDAPEA